MSSTTRRGGRHHTKGWTCNCGCPNGAWRHTCYRCAKPRAEAERPGVCGRRTVTASGYRTRCLKEAGHKGDC